MGNVLDLTQYKKYTPFQSWGGQGERYEMKCMTLGQAIGTKQYLEKEIKTLEKTIGILLRTNV